MLDAKMSRQWVLAPALVLVATGCASFGNKVDLRLADQLQPGVSTREDAEKLLGKPNAVSTGSNGITVLLWSYSHANGFTGNSEAQSLSLVFGPDGKLVRKNTHTTTSTTTP